MLKEKLREKLELEKRALKVVERLLEDSVAEDFLIDCVCTRSTLLTKSNKSSHVKATIWSKNIQVNPVYYICCDVSSLHRQD